MENNYQATNVMRIIQFNNSRFFSYLFKYFPFLCLYLFVTIISCSQGKDNSDQWISLFNGKDLTGWKIKISGHDLNDNYKNTFQVIDGILKVSYDNYDNFDD